MGALTWYTTVDNWHGSFLEVAIELGPPDDDRLLAAFAAAWTSPLLKGPLDSPHPGRPRGVPQAPLDPEATIFTYGTIDIPSATRPIGCEILSVRDPVSDWLDIAIPTGMLELAYPVEYPITEEANPWLAEVEYRLVEVADRVHARVPFDLATVGEEVSGNFYANPTDVQHPIALAVHAISRDVVERAGGFLLSERLRGRLGLTITPKTLPSGLLWVPSTGRSYWSSE